MLVKLEGKTKKGRERVARWGDLWEVLRQAGSGPHKRLMVFAVNDTGQNKTKGLPDSIRWVFLSDDVDFNVKEV